MEVLIDLHCHVLPGIDDGPGTLDESLSLCRVAVSAGIETIVATPHVSWRYRNSAEAIARACGNLNTAVAAEGLPLTILPGAEIALSLAAELDDAELQALRLGSGELLKTHREECHHRWS